jgi:hypothetical protein
MSERERAAILQQAKKNGPPVKTTRKPERRTSQGAGEGGKTRVTGKRRSHRRVMEMKAQQDGVDSVVIREAFGN